jgi:hypothetical protein
MRRAFTMAVRFLVLVAVVTVVGVAYAPASHPASPYLSALSDLSASSALAAKKSCNSMCEFASPGFVCTEGFHSQCTHPATGGCVTASC